MSSRTARYPVLTDICGLAVFRGSDLKQHCTTPTRICHLVIRPSIKLERGDLQPDSIRPCTVSRMFTCSIRASVVKSSTPSCQSEPGMWTMACERPRLYGRARDTSSRDCIEVVRGPEHPDSSILFCSKPPEEILGVSVNEFALFVVTNFQLTFRVPGRHICHRASHVSSCKRQNKQASFFESPCKLYQVRSLCPFVPKVRWLLKRALRITTQDLAASWPFVLLSPELTVICGCRPYHSFLELRHRQAVFEPELKNTGCSAASPSLFSLYLLSLSSNFDYLNKVGPFRGSKHNRARYFLAWH